MAKPFVDSTILHGTRDQRIENEWTLSFAAANAVVCSDARSPKIKFIAAECLFNLLD